MRAIALALALATGAQATPAEDARTQWQLGRYVEAVGIWRRLAETNDPDALYNLGQAYRLGRGVAVDIPAALGYYRRADAAGHARAGEQLGLLLFSESETRSEALVLLDKAARAGAPRAAYILGIALHEGKLVQRDDVLAVRYMQRAADAGIANAKDMLATFVRPLTTSRNAPPVVRRPGVEPAALAQLRPSPETSSVVGDRWAVELGTYKSGAVAAVKWARISARKGLGTQEARFEPVASGVRLVFGRFAQEEAGRLCETLRRDRISCKPFRVSQ